MSTEHPSPYPIDDIEDALEVLAPSLTDKLAAARKGLTAAAGLVGQAIEINVLHGTALHWAQLALAAATTLGVYRVSNVDLPDDATYVVDDEPPTSDRRPDQGPDGQHLPEHAVGEG